MEQISIKELDPKRFNALAAHSRSPAAAYISEEIGWYSNQDESIIGVLLRDTIDDDFAAIVMVRDEKERFRAFDLQTSITTVEEARTWLINAMKWHTGTGLRSYAQGGDQSKGVDLFTPVVPAERLHPYFTRLTSSPAFFPAKSIIKEMMPHLKDVDGNFVEQFQTTGFDARLWELYLHTYITEEELFLDRSYNSPDFIVTKYGKTVAIEAVTVGRKKENPPSYFKEQPKMKAPEEVMEATETWMPIRYGSPLHSKLEKRYWELPYVKGNPLVFAIADFHDDQSMLWSSTALGNYLYGLRHNFYHDEKGNLVITPVKIAVHKSGEKEIPSGFFFQPGAENISAILFSASGTISKFNRLGRQAGFSSPNVVMVRIGTCHDHDPNASVPKVFRYTVDEKAAETWAEGLSMFHNPNAIYPVPEELFPSIAHHHLREDGQIVSNLPDFYPYASFTHNFIIRDDE